MLAAARRIAVRCLRSLSSCAATKVASRPERQRHRVERLSTDPNGDDFVTWPDLEVGEY